jgi:hypothetical protein
MMYMGAIIIAAIDKNDIKFIKSVITTQNADISTPRGLTALCCAARFRRHEIVRYLLSVGATINPTNLNYWPPLTYACMLGDLEMINILINAGAIIVDDNLPRIIYGYKSLENHEAVMKLLIDRGNAELVCRHVQYECIIKFIQDRLQYRAIAILIMGLKRRRVHVFGPNGRDVVTLIMKHLWSMRFGLCDT